MSDLNVSKWQIFNSTNKTYTIYLNIITTEILDSLVFLDFDYNCNFAIHGPCTPELNINKIMEKINIPGYA
jgi:hypothetical protein